MPAKRIDIRNWLADRFGDFFEATITVPAVGTLSTTTISSPRLSQVDESFWKDADLTIAHGGGSYQTKRVTGYQPTLSGLDGGILRLESALTLTPSTSDTFYLYRKASATSYNRAINASLREAGEQGLVECLHTDTSLVATTTIWTYVVPTTSLIERILDLYWLDANWANEPRHVERRAWDFKRQGGVTTLLVRTDTVVPVSMSLQIEGVGPPSSLDTDGAELDDEVPSEYVVDYALGELRLSRWSGNDPEDSARQATFLKQMAEAKLRSAQKFVPRGRLRRHW